MRPGENTKGEVQIREEKSEPYTIPGTRIIWGEEEESAKKTKPATLFVAQGLRLRGPSAGDWGLIPGQGTTSYMLQLMIPRAAVKT